MLPSQDTKCSLSCVCVGVPCSSSQAMTKVLVWMTSLLFAQRQNRISGLAHTQPTGPVAIRRGEKVGFEQPPLVDAVFLSHSYDYHSSSQVSTSTLPDAMALHPRNCAARCTSRLSVASFFSQHADGYELASPARRLERGREGEPDSAGCML